MSRQRYANEAEFRVPSAEYRPVPFWSWNGRLTPDRLVSQIRRMHEAGFGGFFMHARSGLKTAYLEDEWFACVRACVEEAERLGMKAWIYDEKGWPSGFAGGAVPSLGREYRAKALVMLEEKREDDDCRRLLEAYEPSEGPPRYLYEWVQPMGDLRFDSASYVDLLDERVTEAFIASTHERYEREIGAQFGAVVPGVFSDEACALLWLDPAVPALPWTTGLERIFADRYGYSLLPRLHELFLPEGEYPRIRYDYWSLIVELFAERFSKKVYDWCDSRGLLYTGHLMAEDRLAYQMEWVGDIMRQYEYMHIPGLDHLGRHSHVGRTPDNAVPYTRVLSAKQVSSVASQLGRERALSELFACAGQGFEPARQKEMTDWHFIHGINLFSPHLLPYSLEGEGKRDYPPTIGPQQPWWDDYRQLTDYQTRMSYMLTRGRRAAPILVLHPMESAFERYSPLDRSQTDAMNEALETLSLSLLDAQLGFDYGNEHLLAKFGAADAEGLRIKEAVYSAAILPACTRLRSSTVRLLEQFAAFGFPVFYAGDAADGSGLAAVPAEVRHLTLLPYSAELLRERISPVLVLEGKDARFIWLHEREEGDCRQFFLASMSDTKSIRVKMKLGDAMRLSVWDAETGSVRPLACRYVNGGTELDWTFGPRDSLLIRAEPADAAASEPKGDAAAVREEAFAVALRKSPAPLHPNALVLDRFARRNDAGVWSEVRPLADWVLERAASSAGSRYRAAVRVDGEPMRLRVVAERALEASIRWNGMALAASGESWIDPDWLCYDVPVELVRSGANEVEAELSDRTVGPMENLYVTGDFAVLLENGQDPVIRQAADGIGDPAGDLSAQGYPFYAGGMELEFELDAFEQLRAEARLPGRWLLRLPRPSVGSARLCADGKLCGARAWAPWEWEITEQWGKGTKFALVVTSTLRNLIGPHHLEDDESVHFLTPSHFFDRSRRTDRYVLKPLTIGQLELVYRREGTNDGQR
ncbi:glycosyl hydrolase [Cohnella nanjingensis]|uniref:Glycoside hydrolase n=1 Tax=Cohnella nanjingensis TaxID=1387779 RepID=A0A7X0VE77_9BACL|nr:glycosyl hydrolase [Cohnella nanjingensis]MBB6669998.1 hypothetical protein [Cohnella nanjingensis]